MLRIMSFFVLLIISQFSFASMSYETNPATISGYAAATAETTGWCNIPSKFYGTVTLASCVSKVQSYAGIVTIKHYDGNNYLSLKGANVSYDYGTWAGAYVPVYSCPSGYSLSDASGNLSSSGQFCTKSVDSCASFAGQTGYFWVSKVSVPQTICSGTCLATVGSYSNFPDADPDSWQGEYYTYTGETSGCTADTGFTDEATAAAANAAAAERERLKKIEEAIAAAKTACGGEGHYTIGTFNGNTVVTCKDTGVQTTTTGDVTTTTVTNADGSTTTTTTTTTNNTSTTNNNSSITINSDGSTSTSGGSSGTTSGTTTSVVTRDPNGNVISSSVSGASTTSGAVGTCSSDDMADTAGCAELGEAGSGDSDALEESPFDWGFTEQSAFGGASDASCPAAVVIMSGVQFEYDGICQFLRGIRPFILAVAYIVAAMIALGLRTNSGGD